MNIPSSVPKLIVAHPLFRYEDPNQAGWKAGSNEIVGLHKNGGVLRPRKRHFQRKRKGVYWFQVLKKISNKEKVFQYTYAYHINVPKCITYCICTEPECLNF